MIGSFRRAAQVLRHLPVLRRLDFVWRVLRRPYGRVLQTFGARAGVPVSISGERLRLHPDVANLGWEHMEPASYICFRTLVRPSQVVFDVGAHIGTYSLIASRLVGDAGKVVSYEPNARTIPYLRKHIEWNGCHHNVVIREMACGSRTGQARFFAAHDGTAGTSSLLRILSAHQVTVPMVRLDDEIDSLGCWPSLIKIDVEGGEMAVLRGAEALLRQHRPILLLSLHSEALSRIGLTPDAVLGYLDSLNYSCEVIAVVHETLVFAR